MTFFFNRNFVSSLFLLEPLFLLLSEFYPNKTYFYTLNSDISISATTTKVHLNLNKFKKIFNSSDRKILNLFIYFIY